MVNCIDLSTGRGDSPFLLRRTALRRPIAKRLAAEISEYDRSSKKRYLGVRNYVSALELLHSLGVLSGNLLYPCIGNDFFPSYFTNCFGVNLTAGLGIYQKDVLSMQYLVAEAVQEGGLPESYRNLSKKLVIYNCNNFAYDDYLPDIIKNGGVKVLFIKGLIDWVGFDIAFPSHLKEHGRYEYEEKQQLLFQDAKNYLNYLVNNVLKPGGFIVVADRTDMELADYILHLGFFDYLDTPKLRKYGQILFNSKKSVTLDLLGGLLLSQGNIPIRVFRANR